MHIELQLTCRIVDQSIAIYLPLTFHITIILHVYNNITNTITCTLLLLQLLLVVS